MDKNKLEKQSIGIVSQLFDLAEVPVDKRQEINDVVYDYMLKQLTIHSVVVPKGTLCDKCYDTDGFYLGTTCPKCKEPFRSVKA